MGDDLKEVMIIDDDRASLQIAKELLKGAYYAYPLPSVEKMFEALRKVKPDLIMLDINMPGMDGFEAIEKLKADQRYFDIPVIFATGSYAVENAVKGFNLGAVDYVTKPYRNPAFIECINKHLSTDDDSVPLEMDSADDISAEKPIILAVDDSPDILKTVHAVLCDTYKIYTLPKPEKVKDILQTIVP
ncbi:MAG: response regulator, partial [Oscillospiraceae bacterium]|nr:response regulator [Oscillospiraceae bacterium]